MSADNQTKQPWDLEHFKILETALRMQGVKKPLTKEFYESFNELDAYINGLVAQAEARGRVDELNRMEMAGTAYGWGQTFAVEGTYITKRKAELEASLKEAEGQDG